MKALWWVCVSRIYCFFYSAQVVTLLFLPCVPFVPLLLHHFGFLCGTKKAAPQKGPLPELCFPPDILSKLSPHYTHLLTSFPLVFFFFFLKHNGMTSMDAANARCATFLYVSARKKCPALTLKYIFQHFCVITKNLSLPWSEVSKITTT